MSTDFQSCGYVQNNTGYTIYSNVTAVTSGTSTNPVLLANGATVGYAVATYDAAIFTFTMPASATTAAVNWSMTYDYQYNGSTVIEWTAGSASSPGSFGTQLTKGVVNLTLGGDINSFAYQSAGSSKLTVSGVDPVVGGTVGSVAPARGSFVTVNARQMKIWGPRTNPLRGVAAKPTAPVSVGEEVSPVSSTLPAQSQSVAKTATPHRVASRR